MRIIAIVSIWLFSAVLHAQTPPIKAGESPTKLEQATAATNKLVFKTTYDIGMFGDLLAKLHMKAVSVGIGQTKIFGIQAIYTKGDDDLVIPLDVDEVRGMLEAVQQIKSAIPTTAVGPGEYLEATYESKSGLELGFFKSSDSKQGCYLQFNSRSYIFFDAEKFDELGRLLQASIDKVIALGGK